MSIRSNGRSGGTCITPRRLGAWALFLTFPVVDHSGMRAAEPVVSLAPMVVEDSQAGAFYLVVQRTDVPRVWVRSADGPPDRRRRNPELARAPNTAGYLTPLRSFDLQEGDEIISVRGRSIATMTADEVVRVLLWRAHEQPMTLEVRSLNAKALRPATYVLHRDVRAGTKVPRPK
jgi:hypothetical protein